MASARNLPDLMCGMELGRLSIMKSTCWPSSAVTAGAAPGKGTRVTSMPAFWRNISDDMCGDCPTPEVATFSRRVLASCTSSGTLRTGESAWTTRTLGTEITLVMPRRSLSL